MWRFEQFRAELTGSLWFVPSIMVALAIAIALSLVALDGALGSATVEAFPWLFAGEPAASRDMLSIVANSMLTAAALGFSITVVALTLASTQFSPRILRNFMRDRTTQAVLGVFVGIFVYCLVVLRTIREAGGETFVPPLAVAVGAALGLVGMGALIYFLHHIGRSIQASNIIAAIGADTIRVVDELYPEEARAVPPREDAASIDALLAQRSWTPILALETGYLQSIDVDDLVALARRIGGVIRMEYRVGEFVVEGTALASLSSDAASPGGDATHAVNRFCAISTTRTIEQDVAFGIRQLVDIALKALSPAVNDTTTGLNCIDYLNAILARLARRRVGSFYHFAGDTLRVVAKGQTIEDFVDLGFNQIRQNAAGNVAVILRLARSLSLVARAAPEGPEGAECRALAASELRMLADLARRSIECDEDRAKTLRHIARFAASFGVSIASA
jgi:uncharacterized membrane protein